MQKEDCSKLEQNYLDKAKVYKLNCLLLQGHEADTEEGLYPQKNAKDNKDWKVALEPKRIVLWSERPTEDNNGCVSVVHAGIRYDKLAAVKFVPKEYAVKIFDHDIGRLHVLKRQAVQLISKNSETREIFIGHFYSNNILEFTEFIDALWASLNLVRDRAFCNFEWHGKRCQNFRLK